MLNIYRYLYTAYSTSNLFGSTSSIIEPFKYKSIHTIGAHERPVLSCFYSCLFLGVSVLNVQFRAFGVHSSLILLSSDASGISQSELMHTAPDL